MLNRFCVWWRKHSKYTDFGLSVVLVILLIVWAETLSGNKTLAEILKGNRGYVYGSFATIAASLLGFIITAMSIILTQFESDRLKMLREDRDATKQMWDIFHSTTRTLGISALASLAALIVDTDSFPLRLLLYASVWTSALAALRVVRCIQILELIVAIFSKPVRSA